jgi:hypothetical protein
MCSVQAFKYLDTPLLQDLDIDFHQPNISSTHVVEIFSSLSFPLLTHLSMNADWDTSVFSTIMDVTPNARNINLTYHGWNPPFLWDVVLDKLAASGQPVCPRLESCTISDQRHPAILRRSELDSFVKTLQTYRKEHGMPKPRFEIYHRNCASHIKRIKYK